MTYLDIYADAKIEGNKLKLLFRNLGDKNSTGSYLEKGDLLLVLEKQKRGGKIHILTHWKNYTPGFEKHEASGKVYFEKINNNASVSNL